MADLPYSTKLSPQQEAEFQRYAKLRPGYKFDPLPQGDYDERGQWLAQKKGLNPDGTWNQDGASLTEEKSDGPHGSDVWKTPYHRTFSNESKYAMTGREPHWQGSKLTTPTGAVLADESSEDVKRALKSLSGYGTYGK